MVGLHKFDGKNKREQRRRNHVARDLATPKYHQRIIPDRKRIDNDDGTFYLDERYYDDDE
jgi:hypothetical protein